MVEVTAGDQFAAWYRDLERRQQRRHPPRNRGSIEAATPSTKVAPMKTHKWNDIKNKGKSPERIAAVERQVKQDLLAMELVELRREAGLTQTDVAEALATTQGEISRLENRDDRL
ncbi:MAG: helix-turn-helix domain-containing protein, partial [Polyangiaceae bacterium]